MRDDQESDGKGGVESADDRQYTHGHMGYMVSHLSSIHIQTGTAIKRTVLQCYFGYWPCDDYSVCDYLLALDLGRNAIRLSGLLGTYIHTYLRSQCLFSQPAWLVTDPPSRVIIYSTSTNTPPAQEAGRIAARYSLLDTRGPSMCSNSFDMFVFPV